MDLMDEPADSHTSGPEDRGPGVSFLHGRMDGVLDQPLPRGQHDLSRQFVMQHQRTRIMEAMSHVLHEVGYLDATVAGVVSRARVSRRTFYEHFEDKGHCFTATYGASVECVADAVRRSYMAHDAWEDKVAATFSAFMQLMLEYPATGWVLFVQSGISGPDAERSRTAAVRMAADTFSAMLADGAVEPKVSMLQAELTVGALFGLVRARIADGRECELSQQLPETVTALLTSLIGAERAADVAGRITVPPHVEESDHSAVGP